MMSNSFISLGTIDYIIFVGFILLLSVVGFFAGKGERSNSEEYFLAGRKLPWYVIGGSFITANISTEQLIGMLGATFILGISTALWEWLNAFTFLFLIFLFIPFLVASKIVTIPEFLERRFNPRIRHIFAAFTVIANIVIFMAATLYTGGLALNAFTGWDLTSCIIATGVMSGIWAIYGGLSAVAWTGFFTAFVMLFGMSALTTLGLIELGGEGGILNGFSEVLRLNRAVDGVGHEALANIQNNLNAPDGYNRLSVIQWPGHPQTPWTGLFFVIISIGIWYNVLNQFIIQRILGAKNLWHARMGIVSAGFVKVLLPYITVLPGLILFALHPELLLGDWNVAQKEADKGLITLAQELLPIGLRGLLLAALFGAIQSTVSAVVNSTSTVLTFDLYKTVFNKRANDTQLVQFGVNASIATVIFGIIMALIVTQVGGGIFEYVQTLNAFIAPPFAAIFVIGLLWKNANSTGATWSIAGGFLVGILLKILGAYIAMPEWFYPFANQAGMIWGASVLLCIVGSKYSKNDKQYEQIKDILVMNNAKILKAGLGDKWYNSVILWSLGFLLLNLTAMIFFSGLFFPT
jgi:SSS family solute:Na+ symporter